MEISLETLFVDSVAREVEVETTGIHVPCNNSRVGTCSGQCRVSSPGHVDHKINVVAS